MNGTMRKIRKKAFILKIIPRVLINVFHGNVEIIHVDVMNGRPKFVTKPGRIKQGVPIVIINHVLVIILKYYIRNSWMNGIMRRIQKRVFILKNVHHKHIKRFGGCVEIIRVDVTNGLLLSIIELEAIVAVRIASVEEFALITILKYCIQNSWMNGTMRKIQKRVSILKNSPLALENMCGGDVKRIRAVVIHGTYQLWIEQEKNLDIAYIAPIKEFVLITILEYHIRNSWMNGIMGINIG